MYRWLIRPFFFLWPAERAHHLALKMLRLMLWIPGGRAHARFWYRPRKARSVRVFGLTFPNSVGVAAGFDKQGEYVSLLPWLGFGHVEVGTVTPLAQPGNEQPRLFRLPADKALINRMGFNNAGADAVVQNLQRAEVQQARKQFGLVVGGNIGKNKNTPNEDAWKDYVYCFNKLFEVVDYFVVNVSSPNTPGLRALQEKGPLLDILQKLQTENGRHAAAKPLLLKIAPDLDEGALHDIAEVVIAAGLDGVIVSNTTIERGGLQTPKARLDGIGMGGLSGAPLRRKSLEVLRYLRGQLPESVALIGVGGIFTKADMEERLAAGATLVQVYTGFIYEGPGMVRRLLD